MYVCIQYMYRHINPVNPDNTVQYTYQTDKTTLNWYKAASSEWYERSGIRKHAPSGCHHSWHFDTDIPPPPARSRHNAPVYCVTPRDPVYSTLSGNIGGAIHTHCSSSWTGKHKPNYGRWSTRARLRQVPPIIKSKTNKRPKTRPGFKKSARPLYTYYSKVASKVRQV